MNIEIHIAQSDLPLQESPVRDLIREVFSFLAIATDEVHFHFVSDHILTEMHEEYFDDPAPTDCITFPIDPPGSSSSDSPNILGEVFISAKAALRFSPESPFKELSLYIVHGILHLIGLDDIEEEDQKLMRAEEVRVLTHLKAKGLILNEPSSNSSVDLGK